MKSIALTSTHPVATLFAIIGLLVTLGLAAGCATNGDVRIAVADARKAEATDRTTAITAAVKAEATAREAAITALRKGTAAKVVTLEQAITAEREAREAAVTGLNGRVRIVEATVSDHDKKVGEITTAVSLKANTAEVVTAFQKVEGEFKRVERKLVTLDQMMAALSTAHRDRKARETVARWVREQRAEEMFYLPAFPLGSDDVNAALKAVKEAVRKDHASLKAEIAADKIEVVAMVAGQDAVPCKAQKCKDLAERRAKALVASLGGKMDGLKFIEAEQPSALIEHGGELRFAAVLYKKVMKLN